MKKTFLSWTVLATLTGSLCLTACDDDAQEEPADTDGDTDGDTDAALECDPEGPNPEQAALFNAPIEDDVEVVEKVPQHPGEPGPENLP
jgi:hypothetical protein